MSDRMQRIEQALAALRPQHLEIRDDSHRHRGHAGAQDGRGHFAVEVVSEAFRGLPALARHRLVYATLGELMTTDIHALQISAKTQEEIQ
jgi:BolA protein